MGRQQRGSGTSTLIKLTDDELVGHPCLAYLDGYADARTYGENGFFMSTKYNAYDKERYSDGFKKGLRVHRLLRSRSNV